MCRSVPSQDARILVVEDSAAARELLCLVLQAAGYAVEAVGSAAEAIEAVDAHSYDLVLMDLGLPDMDGYAANVMLRRRPRSNRMPVVALTARTGMEEAARCRSADFDGYLTKPYQVACPQSVARVRS